MMAGVFLRVTDGWLTVLRIQIGAFLTPGSGKGFIPDPGTQTHIFEILVTIFWGKSTISLSEFAQVIYVTCSKIM